MRILVIEDEPPLRGAVARRLRARGHSVDLGQSCRDLVEHGLVPERYSVIVLDRLLPDGDSLEVLQRLRAEGLETPVLFLSVLGGVHDRVSGLETGADDYLTKPFAMDELVARVETIGRRQARLQPAVRTVGGLVVHFGRREVRRGGVLLHLRPKEFDLLALLVASPIRVISRAEILERCWEAGDEPRSNVEEVLVANLRRKLGPPGVVRTVRGSGYILDEEACEASS